MEKSHFRWTNFWGAGHNGSLGQLAIADGFYATGSGTCYSNSSGSLGYGYDDLERLIEFDCGSGNWGQEFSYDQYDNLSKAVLSGRTGTTWNPGYSSTTNHCNGCSYDSNGDVTADGNDVYGWNEFSKLKWTAASGTPTCGSSGKCASYDAFGRLVEESNGSTWTEQWITQAGIVYMSGTTPSVAQWSAPGGGTETIGGNSGYFDYLHKDWLGNSRIVSNSASHAITRDQAFTPYGETYSVFGASGSQYNIFAGTTEMFDAGVMWDTPNRELSYVGRWLSPDPAGQGAFDPSNSQNWNRYAYVLNNPLSAIDPAGLDCVRVSQDNIISGTPHADVEVGDCSGSDPNNEFYVNCDGCLQGVQFSLAADGTLVGVNSNGMVAAAFDNNSGNLLAVVNGSLQCSGDCPSATVNVNASFPGVSTFAPLIAGGIAGAQTPSHPSLPSFSAYHPPMAAQKRAAIETECTIESLNANNSSGAPTPAVDGTINSNSAGRNQAVIQQRNAQWPTPSAPNYVTVNPEGTKDAQFAEAIGVPPAYFVYVAKQNCLHNLGVQ
jgi:RHS repeat-associated protein